MTWGAADSKQGRRRIEVRSCDLASLSVNGMLPLLLVLGHVTQQTGQRAPKSPHGDAKFANIHKVDYGGHDTAHEGRDQLRPLRGESRRRRQAAVYISVGDGGGGQVGGLRSG